MRMGIKLPLVRGLVGELQFVLMLPLPKGGHQGGGLNGGASPIDHTETSLVLFLCGGYTPIPTQQTHNKGTAFVTPDESLFHRSISG